MEGMIKTGDWVRIIWTKHDGVIDGVRAGDVFKIIDIDDLGYPVVELPHVHNITSPRYQSKSYVNLSPSKFSWEKINKNDSAIPIKISEDYYIIKSRRFEEYRRTHEAAKKCADFLIGIGETSVSIYKLVSHCTPTPKWKDYE